MAFVSTSLAPSSSETRTFLRSLQSPVVTLSSLGSSASSSFFSRRSEFSLQEQTFRLASTERAFTVKTSPNFSQINIFPLEIVASAAVPKIIIAGAPASGKGTQCEMIVSKFGVTHISTGDLLREQVALGTELGLEAKKFMDAGELVPDAVVIGMVKSRLNQDDCKNKGWLLDGFPRTKAQADALSAAGVVPDIFIVLDVPDEILIERVVGRRTDPVTGKIYHLTFSPPETEEIAARLTQRSDDDAEKVKTRVAAYHNNINAIIDSYRSIMKRLDGTQNKTVVFSTIESLLSSA